MPLPPGEGEGPIGELESLPIASSGRAKSQVDRLSPGHAPFTVDRGWRGNFTPDGLVIRLFHGPGNPEKELGNFLQEANVELAALRLGVNELAQ